MASFTNYATVSMADSHKLSVIHEQLNKPRRFRIKYWNKTNQIENGEFRQALFEKYVIDEENKMIITNLDKNDNANLDLREGLFNDSIIPIGSLLSTKYFISLQLIGLIIVACVIGSIAITKNTIENEEQGDKETI